MLFYFIRRAPRPAVWLLALTALIYVGVVLGPDLLGGGSRSLHARYALPALLVVELMVAWVIATAMTSETSPLARRLGVASFLAIVVLGGLSQFAIHRAETWSTKNFSVQNAEVARVANASGGGLVLASDLVGIGPGELISLAYRLAPGVRIWGEREHGPIHIPADRHNIILLTPSDQLLAALGPSSSTIPIAGTWQWFRVSSAGPAQNQVLSPPAP
jgi:hypothetical protein